MRYIELSKNGKNKGLYRAIVDDEDFDELNKYNWSVKVRPHTCYAFVSQKINGKYINNHMHNFIINAPLGMICDHINHDGLDNRKENLRVCTFSQNSINKRSRKKSSSKYLGVHLTRYKYKDKVYEYWRAEVNLKGKRLNSKYFKSEIDAAKHYDILAKIHFGEFANFNFK